MDKSVIDTAVSHMRLGELKKTVSTLVEEATKSICEDFPLYSDVLKQNMETRRFLVSSSLRTLSMELQRVAEEFSK